MGEDALNTLVQYIDGRLAELRERKKDETDRIKNAMLPTDSLYVAEHANVLARRIAQIRELESVLKIIKALKEGETDEGNHHQTGA